MTDKEQVIIDGVNVRECKHFCLEAQIPEIPFAGYSNICCEENTAKECKDNPNCYFKQRARKTQECTILEEEKQEKINLLEQVIKALYPNADDDELFEVAFNAKFIDKTKTIVQECEELKKTVLTKCPNCNSEYLTPKGIELYEENQNLKQECEELKKELDKEHLLMLEKQDKATRYFLIINGIKEYIYNNTDFDVNDSIQSKTSGYDILQIIKDV